MLSQQQIYDALPSWPQTVLLSLYGYRLKMLRYGGIHGAELESLQKSQWLSKHELEELQSTRLVSIVRHAYDNVAFYRKLYDDHGVGPSDIKDVRDIGRLPVLTKSQVRANAAALVVASSAEPRVTINTSGTSGAPLNVVTTRDAIRRNYAFFARFLGWAGVSIGCRTATFAGRRVVPSSRTTPPFWRQNYALNVTLFSSYHLSDRYLAAYVEQMNRVQPELIDSYPSALHVVARFALSNGLSLPRPRAIVTSSETLLPHQRADIERAFGCVVRDQYGSAEMVSFIAQCEEGSYHINPEYGVTEVQSDVARNDGDGSGRLLCTGFLNTAMPLIRYEIGDTAVLDDGACRCGRHFQRVRTLMGRIDDYVKTPDGRLVGRLDPVFKGVEGIAESQIVQDKTDHVTVYLVPASSAVAPGVGALRENLQARLGPAMTIDMSVVPSIPRTRAGKFRAVVSLVSRPGDRDGIAGGGAHV